MGGLFRKGEDVFSDGGAAKDVDLTYTPGAWQSPAAFDMNVVTSYKITGTAPTALDAQVELSADGGTTSAGVVSQTNSLAGGVEEIQDSTKSLVGVDNSNPHIFTVLVPAGFHWRLKFKRTGGGGTTQILAFAHLIESNR